ncbi:hypothetical protein OHA27_12930 [Streptomyces sp. NBC_01619]|uniref:Uncharacterized protein n=1 Tax=Streptomyces pratisoli TaxID=3139917 RepID=A0ACC6Q9T1_9ACTN|nr:hypothetical protein [Streptomyces sp. NBC_01619]MCX4511195.1 hypothetical protein [Streptomyces sp. NBC_01619]
MTDEQDALLANDGELLEIEIHHRDRSADGTAGDPPGLGSTS